MSYINNMNPRRMIWFNQNAPKNKMDLWLSYNRHYEDVSEDETTEPQQTTDNPNQRNCDLILKAWDCGQWVPIVGFNTTSANKIDIVEGNTLYHPAIFTGENPNDLYDAGSLGSLLSNSNFVTQLEWLNIFNSVGFQGAWSTIINNIPIRRATSNALGGVWADTFATVDANGFAQCKFIGSSDSNLYVSGSDIIGAINTYYTSGGTTPINIQLATTTTIGGIKSDKHEFVANAFRPVECKFYPNYTTWSLLQERLCVNVDDIVEQIINSLNDQNNKLLIGSHGVTIGLILNSNQIEWKLDNLETAQDGKYARSKHISGSTRHTIEWVDLPSGTTYTTLASGTASGTECVVLSGGSDKQFLNGYGEWAVPEGTTYTGGVGIYIPSGTTEINQHIFEITSEGDSSETQDTNILITDDSSGRVVITQSDASSILKTTTLESYNYTELSTFANKLTVNLQNKNTNPIYIKLSSIGVIAVVGVTGNVINTYDIVASGIPSGNTLLTVLLGAIKAEPMKY